MKKERCSTQVQFTVNLADLKRSSRRLLTRLSDESEAGGEFVVFNATGDGLQIVADRTSEGLAAIVSNAGVARMPYPVFRGIVRTLSTYDTRKLTFTFSAGQLTVNGTVFRHPQISVGWQVWVPEILAREFRKFWHVLLQPARPPLSSGDGCAPRAHRGG
jgi:hypothetical protein